MRRRIWVFKVALFFFSWLYVSTSTDSVVLRIHTYIMKNDFTLIGSISFPSTMELIRIGESGSILRLCSWCPQRDELRSEIDFIVAQEVHLRAFQNGADDRSAHSTYEFILGGDTCSYQVNHTNDECETIYRSSGERIDTRSQCNLTNEQVRGVRVRDFLEVCSVLSEKWIFVYRKLVDAHRINKVYALFWKEFGKDGNYTTCILRSSAPFINRITMSGPGLEDVSGATDEGANDTVTEAYNHTYPNMRCHIESPTGWSAIIVRPSNRKEKISLIQGVIDLENDEVDAADIRVPLLSLIGFFLVVFSIICWFKRRDIVDAVVEIYCWWRGNKRGRYIRVS
ncbi:pr155 [rat cytomegalovirus strain Maastricht]|uniref:Pr155 n=1 Tax=Rat cytomegalovirus (strain Maastricht) TaxID=79700 RepID=Q9DW35_RCMVM|nr:pr155 [rat cytomegalovirus strain Maastricht]AAF99255.1 pr155 [rat cytomegalovirus strain Maastricht]WEG72076.1 membrane protein r162 [Murid betaherpesvirus 2]